MANLVEPQVASRSYRSRKSRSVSAFLPRRSLAGVATDSKPSTTRSVAASELDFRPAWSIASWKPIRCESSVVAALASFPPMSKKKSSRGLGDWRLLVPARPMCIDGLPSGSTAAWRRSATPSNSTTRSMSSRLSLPRTMAGCGRKHASGSTSFTRVGSRLIRLPHATAVREPVSIDPCRACKACAAVADRLHAKRPVCPQER